MAIQFDGATGYLTIPAFNLPTAPWALVLWFQKPNNAGSSIEYLVNNGGTSQTDSAIEVNIYQASNSNTGRRNRVRGIITPAGGASHAFMTPDDTDPVMAGDSTWRVLVIQQVSAASWEAWICPQNGVAVKYAVSTTNIAGVTLSGSLYLGRVSSGGNYFNGAMAEFSFGPYALTQAEIEAIASGKNITDTGVRNPALAPTCYLPLTDNSATQNDQSVGGTYDGTVNGTITTVTHPYAAGSAVTLISRPKGMLANSGWTDSAPLAVASITRSGTTATITFTPDHNLATGNFITIRGADQADYNGTFLFTKTGAKTGTFTVANSPTTPATGTIVVDTGFQPIDESVIDDSDYILAAANASITLDMQDMLDPGTTQQVKIIIRAQKIVP